MEKKKKRNDFFVNINQITQTTIKDKTQEIATHIQTHIATDMYIYTIKQTIFEEKDYFILFAIVSILFSTCNLNLYFVLLVF